MNFSEEQLVKAVRARYRGSILINAVRAAMRDEQNLSDAVDQVVMECAMWDSPSGNPLDCTNIILTPSERERKNQHDDRLAIMKTVWNTLLKGHQVFNDVARMVSMQAALRKYELPGGAQAFLRRLVETGFLTNGCLEDVKILRINPKNPKFVQYSDPAATQCLSDGEMRERLDEFLERSWPLYPGLPEQE